MGINSNVKKSDVLSTKEINELAVKFQNSVDKKTEIFFSKKFGLQLRNIQFQF